MPKAINISASGKARVIRKSSRKLNIRKGHSLLDAAKEAIYKAQSSAYRDRKIQKRNFRRLWIQRISAACREHGLNYSQFTKGLYAAGIEFNRKVLADLTVTDPDTFDALVVEAKNGLEAAKRTRGVSRGMEVQWTEEQNRRRCTLIDMVIAGQLSDSEQVELEALQQRMLAHRREVAPLPLDDLRELHQQLLSGEGEVG